MQKKTIAVAGQNMAYVEAGAGKPIVLLHGNPTSSYLWRDVIPALTRHGRCIAPDLIGMGDSAKLPEVDAQTYTFDTHSRYLDGFMDTMGLSSDVLLVIHDWGSALGFDWANRHRSAMRGIAYMEGIVRPLASWNEFNPQAAPLFQALRTEAGPELILEKNTFIERILPGSVLRTMSEDEMAEYRRPFRDPESRYPMLTWPRQIPVAGDPVDVVARVQAYADWLVEANLPKLFINAEPGAILIGAVRDFCRTWPNQDEVTVKGSHFIQEDSGAEIGAAIANWIETRAL